MKKINIISGFIITFVFMLLISETLLSNFDEYPIFKAILYVVSLFSSSYYFVVRHMFEE